MVRFPPVVFLFVVLFAGSSPANAGTHLKGAAAASRCGTGAWGPGVFKEKWDENNQFYLDGHEAKGSGGAVIAGSSEAIAVYAGQFVMTPEIGGNAVDAALATAFAQIVIAGGSYISFAGLAQFTVYNATTKNTSSVDGFWAAPLADTPAPTPDQPGTTVMTPGFLRAAEKLHRLGGSVAWSCLFDAAIDLADGFPMPMSLYYTIKANQQKLGASEGGRIFLKDGGLYSIGDTFAQPGVAKMLRGVQTGGADTFYTGDFASEFESVVTKAGGVLTKKDLDKYEAYERPVSSFTSTYDGKGLKFVGPGGEAIGTFTHTLALRLLSHLPKELVQHPPHTNGTSLFWQIQCARTASLISSAIQYGAGGMARVNQVFPNLDQDSAVARLASDMGVEGGVAVLQEKLKSLFSTQHMPEVPKHSASIVTHDTHGNVVSMVHTINAGGFGSFLFVQGVALTNAATLLRVQNAAASRGHHLVDGLQPMIVLNPAANDTPVAAYASIGAGLLQTNVQVAEAMFRYGSGPQEADNLPMFGHDQSGKWFVTPLSTSHPNGGYDSAVVKEAADLGQTFDMIAGASNPMMGMSVVLRVEGDGTARGGCPYPLAGAVYVA